MDYFPQFESLEEPVYMRFHVNFFLYMIYSEMRLIAGLTSLWPF